MIESFASLAFSCFVLTSLVVGVRILRAARRARPPTTRAVAIALLAGGSGYGLAITAFALGAEQPRLAALVNLVGVILLHVGAAAAALTTRYAFHPRARWARALQLSLTTAIAAAFSARLAAPEAFPAPDFVFWPSAVLSAGCYGWAAAESALAALRLRNPARPALAPAASVRRLLAWSVAAGAVLALHGAAMASRLASPAAVAPGTMAIESLLGLVAALALAVASLPEARPALLSGSAPALD